MNPAAVLLVGVLLFAAPAFAADRVDLFDATGHRIGYGTVDRERGTVDLFAPDGRRIGYGTVTPTGAVNLYAPNGARLDGARLGPVAPAGKGR